MMPDGRHGECDDAPCMTVRDPVDLLYGELVADDKLKHGTKYERLAALVFKELNQVDAVRHDVRLRGDGRRTQHQIDVRLTSADGTHLRAIVECRHLFGAAGNKKLGLGPIRDFASVQRDLVADEAWIVTTAGFTRPAEIYADEEGIRLATLKALPAAQLKRIDFRGRVGAPSDLRITTWLAVDDAERERVKPLLAAQGQIADRIDTPETRFLADEFGPGERIFDVMDPIYQRLQKGLAEGINTGTELFDRPRRIALGAVPVTVRGFDWEIELSYGRFDFSINLAERIARLMLESLDGRVRRRFSARDLGRWRLTSDREVVKQLAPAPEARALRRSR